MIRPEVMEVMKGEEQIPFKALTKDIEKDFYIISYYLAEKLPDSVPFNLKDWKIVEYNEDTIVLNSNKREWIIRIMNLYSYDEILTINYIFYTIRQD